MRHDIDITGQAELWWRLYIYTYSRVQDAAAQDAAAQDATAQDATAQDATAQDATALDSTAHFAI